MSDTLHGVNYLSEPAMSWGSGEDERLIGAVQAAQVSGKLTPLIKEELWCVIQSRRLSRGCDELVIDTADSTSNNSIPSLSSKDLSRRYSRMEQNRRAARKYRQKKREEADIVHQETERLLSDNSRLKTELADLQAQKSKLRRILLEHLQICPFAAKASSLVPCQQSHSPIAVQHSQSPNSCQQFQSPISCQPPQSSVSSQQSENSFASQQCDSPFASKEYVRSFVSQESMSPFASEESGSPFGPQESGSPFGPQESGSPFAPQESGSPFASQESRSPFIPQESGSPFAFQESGSPFAPQESGSPFASQESRSPFASPEPGNPFASDHSDSPFSFHQSGKLLPLISPPMSLENTSGVEASQVSEWFTRTSANLATGEMGNI